MTKADLTKYAPVALGVISGGTAALCLWVAAALLRLDGAGLVAFAALSGGFFWCSGVFLAVMIHLDRRDREEWAARREALREQLKMGVRRTI